MAMLMLVISGLTRPTPTSIGVDHSIGYFKTETVKFAVSTSELKSAIQLINNKHPETIEQAKNALLKCRSHYKRIEFFIQYFFPQAAKIYNSPANYEIEEPSLEFREPVGLQVIESLLFDADVESKRSELLQQVDLIGSSAMDLNSLLYNLKADDRQLLESLRLDLIRVITLGVTGFDAPLLKSGVSESREALISLDYCLQPFLKYFSDSQSDSVTYYLTRSLSFLKQHDDFDSFDRLTFFTENVLPLQQYLGSFIKVAGLELNTNAALNYDAKNIFSADAFNASSFNEVKSTEQKLLIELGKTLFFENALSGNIKRNCASCHQPERFFVDGLVKNSTVYGGSDLKRNTPTLLYATYQYSQLWDGRVESLNDQIKDVIASPLEMDGDHNVIVNRLKTNQNYQRKFKDAFPETPNDFISIDHIATAITVYLKSLNPMNSAFDKYVQGNRAALMEDQKKGFNLFMGKAQCGTCHFAPLFNGLLPPLYNISEFEVLGTPKTDDLTRLEFDTDSGRYNVFPIQFYIGAFRTPTLRNIAKTAPYMHNGAFQTLDKVMEFYNKGGGNGLGLNLVSQTLPSDSLKLTDKEIKDIISFLNSLTDTLDLNGLANSTVK